jgi:hypothetical protein
VLIKGNTLPMQLMMFYMSTKFYSSSQSKKMYNSLTTLKRTVNPPKENISAKITNFNTFLCSHTADDVHFFDFLGDSFF